MSLEIFPSGPLKGTVRIQGDNMLSLSTLLFGMTSGADIEIYNLPDSPDVQTFIDFLCNNGAKTEKKENSLRFKGSCWEGSLLVDEKIPKEILHQFLASCVFLCETITINGSPDFLNLAGYALEKLAVFSLKPENIKRTETSLFVEKAMFSPPEEISAGGLWEFELYSAAAFSKKAEINISHGSAPVDYILKQLDFFGFRADVLESVNSREKELMRRMKRLTGEKEKPPKKFRWHGNIGSKISIPGDTVLAAAVCASTSMIEKSSVEIKNVLLENGRRGIFESLKKMKCDIEWQPSGDLKPFESADIKARWSKKEGVTVSFGKSGMLPSEAFIFAVTASLAHGETIINGLSKPLFDENELKEFVRNIEKIGVHIGCFPDGLIIDGVKSLAGGKTGYTKATETHPALAVAGIAASGETLVEIADNNDYYLKSFFRIVGNLSGSNAEIRWNE